MLRKICKWLLYKRLGWEKNVTVSHPDKFIICLAPHTSNADFLLGWTLFFIAGFILNWYLAYRHLRQADLTYCKLSKE